MMGQHPDMSHSPCLLCIPYQCTMGRKGQSGNITTCTTTHACISTVHSYFIDDHFSWIFSRRGWGFRLASRSTKFTSPLSTSTMHVWDIVGWAGASPTSSTTGWNFLYNYIYISPFDVLHIPICVPFKWFITVLRACMRRPVDAQLSLGYFHKAVYTPNAAIYSVLILHISHMRTASASWHQRLVLEFFTWSATPMPSVSTYTEHHYHYHWGRSPSPKMLSIALVYYS